MENRINKRLLVVVFCTVLACISTNGIADSSVWKISKGDSHIYLGGTIHVLSKSDFPLPEEFNEAYGVSDLLVFETDMVKMADPVFSQKMMQQLSYKDGSTIRDHLKPRTIALLEQHFTQRSMSLDQFATLKPPMLFLLLTYMELEIMGIDQEGVDAHFSALAAADGKTQLHLESPQYQLDFIAGIGRGDPDRLLEYTLRDLAQMRPAMDAMLKAWREGDPEDLDKLLVDMMASDYPAMYETLLVKRNNEWFPIIARYFSTADIEFVLVGAAHLVGEVGLLEQLENAGYTVEQF